MTGEMSHEEVTREAFPLHFAIADAFDGTVHPFDQYQGPYIRADGHKFWLICDDGCVAVYLETVHRRSDWIPPFIDDAMMSAIVVDAARDLSNGGGFDPDYAEMYEDAARLAEIGEA